MTSISKPLGARLSARTFPMIVNADSCPKPFNDSQSSGVTLFACSFCPVPLKKSDPDILLPPVFGTMFIVRPAVSVSPRPPEVMNVTSWALPTSAIYAETPPPLLGAPTFMPSIWMAPSLARPPRAVKKLLLVCTPVLNPVACTAGLAAR